jgi:hypothetical protein
MQDPDSGFFFDGLDPEGRLQLQHIINLICELHAVVIVFKASGVLLFESIIAIDSSQESIDFGLASKFSDPFMPVLGVPANKVVHGICGLSLR